MQQPTQPTAPGSAAEPVTAPHRLLAGLALTMLLSSFGTSVANVALPALAGTFGAPFRQVQWVVIAYLLATTTLIVGAGRLGDIIGRRRLLLAGIGLFTAAAAASGAAASLGQLVAARAAQGLGGAVMMALTVAFVSQAVPKARIGSAMGLLGSASAVGTALGPSLGGVLLAAFGWRIGFLIVVPFGLLAMALLCRPLPRDGERSRDAGFDVPGTVLFAATLGAYALAMTTGRAAFGVHNLVLLLTAVAGMLAFAAVERRTASPLVQPSLLRETGLASGLAMNLAVATVMMTTLVIGPFYLSRSLGLDPAGVGMVMSAGPVAAAIAGAPAGRAVDRFGSGIALLGGLLGIAFGCLLLAALPVRGLLGYIVPIVVVTASYALFQAANNTAIMADVAAERRGLISGMLNLSRNLGLMTGASLMGTVFAVASGSNDVAQASADAVEDGMRATFAVAAALMVVMAGAAARPWAGSAYGPSGGAGAGG